MTAWLHPVAARGLAELSKQPPRATLALPEGCLNLTYRAPRLPNVSPLLPRAKACPSAPLHLLHGGRPGSRRPRHRVFKAPLSESGRDACVTANCPRHTGVGWHPERGREPPQEGLGGLLLTQNGNAEAGPARRLPGSRTEREPGPAPTGEAATDADPRPPPRAKAPRTLRGSPGSGRLCPVSERLDELSQNLFPGLANRGEGYGSRTELQRDALFYHT